MSNRRGPDPARQTAVGLRQFLHALPPGIYLQAATSQCLRAQRRLGIDIIYCTVSLHCLWTGLFIAVSRCSQIREDCRLSMQRCQRQLLYQAAGPVKFVGHHHHHHHHHHHLSLNREDFTTSFLHFFPVLHCPLGICQLQAGPFLDIVRTF